MFLKSWIDKVLSRSAKPTQPAKSFFDSERQRKLDQNDKHMEFEIEKEKHRGRGF